MCEVVLVGEHMVFVGIKFVILVKYYLYLMDMSRSKDFCYKELFGTIIVLNHSDIGMVLPRHKDLEWCIDPIGIENKNHHQVPILY